MAVDKFYIVSTGNTKGMGIETMPIDSIITDLIGTESDSSYIYFYGGDEYAPTSMNIDYYYSSTDISSKVGTDTINKCKFNVRAASLHEGVYIAYVKITYKGTQILKYNPTNTFGTYSVELAKNPITNSAWTLSDLASGFYFEMYTGAPGELRVATVSMEIDHSISHEVLNTPMGYIKIKKSSSILTIPYFNTSLISYPALRIKTSKGIGAFSLVDVTDSYSSPIRIKTPKGVKAIAYQK